jgi:cyclopropane-fatty-acyl-phospholipid synthase
MTMHHDVKLGDARRTKRTASLPLLGGLLRSLVSGGCLTIIDSAGRRSVFGNARAGPSVTVRLHEASLPARIALSPSRAFGEAYMDGTLTIEAGDVRQLLFLVTGNFPAIEERPLHAAGSWLSRHLRTFLRSNGPLRSRRNVAHHYDLSGTLYDLFLDADQQYSCAYFVDQAATLEQAQAAKKRHIAAKLLLAPGQRVLDIGCGWGGLAIELARDYGVDVTGITLSDKQLQSARRRAERAGLGDRVRFELMDYRSIEGCFDRIVSVGMFEHVGARNYGAFFSKVRDSLAPDGIALLSAIGRMAPPAVPDPWISKYIFPGGYIPSLSETLAAIEPSHLWVTDIEILRVHYAETLKRWFDRFEDHRAEAAALYDERFCRMWEFYLAACEMLFRNGPLMVFHMQLARRRDAVPLTRDYISVFDRRPESAFRFGPKADETAERKHRGKVEA